MLSRHTCASACLSVALFLFGAAAIPASASPPARVRLVASGLNQPVCIAYAPGDLQHLFVCDRLGRIKAFTTSTGAIEAADFLDITPLVSSIGDGGLLGLAFDPAFPSNGYFYVFYNAMGGEDRVLARYHVAPGSLVAEPASAVTIWRYSRSVGHNGGWIGFNPINGYLYLSQGDGGTTSTLDGPNRARQTITNQLMGKMLRIDVGGDDFPADPNRNYRIPPTNPFVAIDGDDEIWAYGVRNPWRCSIDRQTGDLWIADVGQAEREEIDFEPVAGPGGRNYGWRCTEGTFCTGLSGCTCGSPALTAPFHEYDHAVGRSITGGYVYRGAAIPALQGLYFFADFQDPRIFSLRNVAGTVHELTERTQELRVHSAALPIFSISTLGEDAAGELYFADFNGGLIYQMVPYPCPPVVDIQPASVSAPVGMSIQLTVVGAGTDPLTLRWRKDAVPLTDVGRISGTTTFVLAIANIQPTDAGDYDLELSDACGSITTNIAHLTATSACRGDFNGVGGVTVQDIFDFLAAYFSGNMRADINGVGGVTVQDIFDFLAAYFAPCP